MSKQTIKELLVASDSTDSLRGAVEKVALIEHYSGAAVTALLVCHDPIVDELPARFGREAAQGLIDEMVRNETYSLQENLAGLRTRVAELRVDVAFAREPAAVIADRARIMPADLIVKPLGRSHRIADFLHAPCPVLFTRPPNWEPPRRVLAAVDLVDSAHEEVNVAIVRNAVTFASMLGAELHIATAFPALAPYVTQYQISYDRASLRVEMHDARHNALVKLLSHCAVEATPHVIEGRARDVVASLAAELHASVTVLGTAGRSGLKKLLIGNTAEAIVGDLSTDLLTVRQH
jgi:universal stress protein E